ncbi:uncharacterized protein LOC121869853 [Homarus americanus]|uniref:uncharacterized protein LOC121869853 n=1 Tax=Homarus americanus TaxID=6706 RepID=UPI001C46680D|nr:uncharacterized protein LOC121869853 [Homarus americanus]
MNGTIVGTGFDSLLKQLQLRFDNINSKSNDQSMKRKKDDVRTDDEDLTAAKTSQKDAKHDTYGESRLCGNTFMLAIDGIIVNDHVSTFDSGLAMLSVAYYILNIKYPIETAATMEFIQRCFVGINSDRGSKIEVKLKGKRYTQVHPKVLSFINRDESEEREPQITWGRANSNTAYFHDQSPTNVTAMVGLKASLPCRVLNLDKKDVSWIRQRDLHILTVGLSTYTSDDRFKVYHPEDSDKWYLEISSVTFRDAGVYECQVSTSPKISLPVLLTVEVGKNRANLPGPTGTKVLFSN